MWTTVSYQWAPQLSALLSGLGLTDHGPTCQASRDFPSKNKEKIKENPGGPHLLVTIRFLEYK